ncbi:MAG: lipid-transfer protein [Proteobacteria bacterium]|jgi:sterol carrier protein 2|nr:lipid-transfer protein [Pseudomonadota bacterium]
MSHEVFVSGVGMIPFVKPGTSGTYQEMGEQAVRLALEDSGASYDQVQQVYAGYVYGDSTCGQAAVYRLGMSGIPVINVNNNCSTGSTALFLARQAIEGGVAECVLALGFEQMNPGALGAVFEDRPNPLEKFIESADEIEGKSEVPVALRLFGGAGLEHQKKYGTRDETFARVSQKARLHAKHNPRAIFRDEVSIEEVLSSPPMHGVLTRLQCCPPTCGAAAALLTSEKFAKKHGLRSDVKMTGQSMTTDFPSSFEGKTMMQIVGSDMSQAAANDLYERTGIGPDDVDVVELHDCFTSNEIITYEALQLTEEGGSEQFVSDGDNTYGGKVVVNPSGGLLSKGHPLGATGLGQCAELVWQLRGEAGPRQVEGARVGLQHNLGLGGACVVSLYQKM